MKKLGIALEIFMLFMIVVTCGNSIGWQPAELKPITSSDAFYEVLFMSMGSLISFWAGCEFMGKQ